MTRRADITWAAWMAAVVASFAAIESKALKNPEHGHTLTATSKRWLGVHPRQPWGLFGSVFFSLALSWVAAHIIAEGENVPRWIQLKAASKAADLETPGMG